ncbi:MAG: NADH-quinone oxidoreductase subunit H [Caldisericia bacterium]
MDIINILIITGISIVMFMFVMVVALAYTLVERKFLGWIQQRLGPMEVGPWGLFQPLADAVKLLGKGDVMPKLADKFLYTYTPIISFVPAFIVFSLIPIATAVTHVNGTAVISLLTYKSNEIVRVIHHPILLSESL